MRKMFLPLVAATVVCTGCFSTAIKQGDIVSVTERFVGVKISQSTQTDTPQVNIGWGSVNFVCLPTSTNTIHAPNFANCFRFGQTGLMSHSITEELASGAMQTLQPGETNSSVTITPRKIDP